MTFKNILPDQHIILKFITQSQKKKKKKDKMLPWSQRVNKWDNTCLSLRASFFFIFSFFLRKETNVHRNKADSCRARQCISSDPTAFPLPPYCSSTHGLAYEITLTKADGNSGVSCWCDLPCVLVDYDHLRKYVSGLHRSCWRILVPLKF